MKHSLAPEKLRATLAPERVPYKSSDDIPATGLRTHPQKRAFSALELAMHIRVAGYNIFLAGEPDLGRRYMLLNYLAPRAKRGATPADLCYVYNFADQDCPLLLTLPAGQGKKLKRFMAGLVSQLTKEVPRRLEQAAFMNKRNLLASRFQNKRDSLIEEMGRLAEGEGFILSLDEAGGMMLYPTSEGRRLTDQEIETMPTEELVRYKKKSDNLLGPMSTLMRELAQAEQQFAEAERSLEQETVESFLRTCFDGQAKKQMESCRQPELATYFAAIRADILENHAQFTRPENTGMPGPGGTPAGMGGQAAPPPFSSGRGPNGAGGMSRSARFSLAPPALCHTLLPQGRPAPAPCASPYFPAPALLAGRKAAPLPSSDKNGRMGAGTGGWPEIPVCEFTVFDEFTSRYDVNVFVDNSETTGAPVVFDDHPTMSNLMGAIERESEMGALVTNFSLIKAGALHRANGGYLVLHAEDILHHPAAWEALIRTLRSGLSRLEDSGEDDVAKTKGLRPQPVPVSLKVILVGTEDIYDALLAGDERFSKLFKVKAHMTEYMPRNATGIKVYLSHIKHIITNDSLLPFTRDALARLVDCGSRLIEDQQKLSLKFPLLREIMVEASAHASLSGKGMVDASLIEKAQDERSFRSNLVEEAFMEDYDRRIIKVVTSGSAIGRANGLAVSTYGDFEFGLPHQISCTIGAGSGGIIDLEREAQLGGPIHTKAMMILKTYLIGAFAHNKPLILTGSLGFEQSYFGIEGDSASGAELAALLSALSGVPNRLSIAFTGAVGQSGEIMAVGSVTRKIEGFFEVCKRHGLTGDQGVLLPRDNVPHLMLHKEVVEAVRTGRFHILTAGHIAEAMELLSGMPAGKRRKNGTYPPGTLFALVDQRLAELARVSTMFRKKR
jgi:Predicted ATP-dependent protease